MVWPIAHHPWKSTHKNQVTGTRLCDGRGSTLSTWLFRLPLVEFSRTFTTPLHKSRILHRFFFPFLQGSWNITRLGRTLPNANVCRMPPQTNHLYLDLQKKCQLNPKGWWIDTLKWNHLAPRLEGAGKTTGCLGFQVGMLEGISLLRGFSIDLNFRENCWWPQFWGYQKVTNGSRSW